ncbi:hypothetical protein [Pseudoduganella sp. GCM10020061]|uniref:hypothetical protein n=1 Tax=Pseudoduganella sp. GCM10020061 TaxID=3317345 RepID=UPI00363C2B27
MQSKKKPMFARPAFYSCLALAALLTACGGGGGNPGSTGVVPNPGGGGSNPGGGTTNPTPANPVVTLALVDGTGAAINSLSGAQTGTLRATVKTGTGALVPNAVVTFAPSTSGLVSITPPSALTDANGVAVTSVTPASVQAAGALSISATSVIDGLTGSASVNMAVGAAPLTLGALSLSPVPTGPLPAFSTVQLNVPVTSGGQPANSVSGLNLSSLCAGDGTATLVQGSLANGVQTATYTNKGCLRGRDTITASIGNSVQTIQLDVSPASIGAINFVGSSVSNSSIVLRGSGGLGRSESAQVTFKVVDQHNNGLAGVDVNFKATTNTGGLTVSPLKATTDAQGNVATVVSSGTIPTPVRVVAEATRGGSTISGLSDTLTISTGLPIQKSMSMSTNALNIEGANYDGTTATVTVMMADQYGNPISDGTAINFVTEGGSIGSSAQGACTTLDGGCSVTLRSQEFRPLNGRVTVLAYAQGIENFTDMNGDGMYSCANPVIGSGTVYRPLVDSCASGGEPFADQADAFLDTGDHAITSGVRSGGTLDGVLDPVKHDLPFPYNRQTYSNAGDGKWGINYIRQSMEMVFSGSDAHLVRQVCSNGVCRDWTGGDGDPSLILGVAGTSCKEQTIVFRLFDDRNNPMPADSVVGIAGASKLQPKSPAPSRIPSTSAIGGTFHSVVVTPDDTCESGSFAVTLETPRKVVTSFNFRSE